MGKLNTVILKVCFSVIFAVIIISNHPGIAAEKEEFLRDLDAIGKFWEARKHNTVQLFSVNNCTAEQAKSEFERLRKEILPKGIDLHTYDLFATRVEGDKYGWGAVGVFEELSEAQALATQLNFLKTNPYVRPKAKSMAVTLAFVLYRESTSK